MTSFTKLDWDQLDTHAIVNGRGLVRLSDESAPRVRAWLAANEYESIALDFSAGIGSVVRELATLVAWERNFGYAPDGSLPHVVAMSEALDLLSVPQNGGLVLELSFIDAAIGENETWTMGLLRMIARQSLKRLALGERFFAVIHPDTSHPALVDRALDEIRIPAPFRFRK
jgi:hypothetical protein